MLARLTALAVVAVFAALPMVTQAQSPQFTWKAGTATAGGNPLNDTM